MIRGSCLCGRVRFEITRAVGPFELHEMEKAVEATNDSALAICEEIHVQALSAMSYLAIKSAEDLSSHVQRSMPFGEAYERYGGGRISLNDGWGSNVCR